MESKPKSIWRSKTFWVALVTFVVSLVTFLMGSDLIKQYPEVVAVLGMILGVLNVVLRAITDTAVTMMGKSKRDRMKYDK